MSGAIEEKSMVPTILVGIGGTGHEVLTRVRRLVEESYGSLRNFPILGFLVVDTDKDYKVSNPLSAGTPFRDNEKHWASVAGNQVRDMMEDMQNYPWIDAWFPRELERNMQALEAGAGQIRACGRFAFFYNYHEIQKKFKQACDRVKGKENLMLSKHGVKVSNSALNVFVTGSMSGGTGSGMLIDIGYAIRHWLQGQGSPLVTAIVPMPTAFSGIDVGDRVLANGYAAMMELSYFSDHRTEYVAQFSRDLNDEIRSRSSPFDFTYLAGTKNGENDFKLDQIREMIAQNIYLDLTSDFAPHKRSIRDNIKSAWANQDPGGRGYPKNFMSFGLSTVEIPIAQIRTCLANRLATDFVGWWLNESVVLPPNVADLTKNDILKGMRLTEAEMLGDLSSAGDRLYVAVISEWINSLREEIANDDKLSCTQEGINVLSSETGKILQFVDGYMKPKVDEFQANNLRDLSPDERLHGGFLKKMYDNRDQIIMRGRKALEEEFYRIIADRTRGPKFADAFIVEARQILDSALEKFQRESEKVWQPNEKNRRQQYEVALQDITSYRNKYAITKKAAMEELCEAALMGIEGSFTATVQRKARDLAKVVIARLKEHLDHLSSRLARLSQKLHQLQDSFKAQADRQADSADVMEINGYKLFHREELNGFYQNLIEQLAGASESSKTRYELGMDSICSTLSQQVLNESSPLWKETRTADEIMRLFDIPSIPDGRIDDFEEVIAENAKNVITTAPESCRLKTELAACDYLFKECRYEESAVSNKIRIAYNKSKPLIKIDSNVLRGDDAGFTPATNIKVAILGGRNTTNASALKFIPLVQEFVPSADAITPLGESERYRVVFVQETGGFSMRCIEEMKQLRKSYQSWKGDTIIARRAKLRGENRDVPIPVHIQKEPPFWDVFPEDPEVFKLVIQARAFGVLRPDENRSTREHVIRYTRQTAIDPEDVDLASTWEEVAQVLEVLACRPDREEIQKQVTARLDTAETDDGKQLLFQQLRSYLDRRAVDLEKEGGKDSPIYKRESAIVLDVINLYKLKIGSEPAISAKISVPEVTKEVETQPLPVKPEPETTSSVPKDEMLGKLKELASLKQAGILSEEEFVAAKKQILGL
jgi:Tubulin like